MWQILRAEIAYNRLNYLIFLALIVPVLAYDSLREASTPTFLAWLFMFLMVNNWNAFRIREKRSFQLAQLPVPAVIVGLARFALIAFFSGSFILAYAVLQALLTPETAVGGRVILCLFALTVTIFTGALIFRDRFVGTKALGQGKMLIVILIGLATAASFYGLIVARRASESGGATPAFVRVIRFAIDHNPADSNLRTATFVAAGLVLGFLSVVTFTRRKTHVE
jgi:hypothetical protein